MRRMISFAIAAIMLLSMLNGCTGDIAEAEMEVYHTYNERDGEGTWTFGFGVQPIVAEGHEDGTDLYIAGYNSGWYASGYMDRRFIATYQNGQNWKDMPEDPDYSEARAIWMDAGAGGVLLIGIDCVGLSKTTVDGIRDRLFTLCSETGCISVNVFATHSHASADSLGLWGPLAVEGKNDDYMEALTEAAVKAAELAVANRRQGELRFGKIETEGMIYDSRDPQVYDPNLYQLRFAAADGGNGARLLFYGAHAESMRGDNTMLSRDFPGLMCDVVEMRTGDPAMFLPGAIGGLMYTNILTDGYFDAMENMELTGLEMARYALSIRPENETVIPAELSLARTLFTAPMDNPMYMYLKFLGILGNEVIEGESSTGYMVRTEMSILRLGELHIVMMPGEIFPELVSGKEYHYYGTEGENPTPLKDIAAEYGVENLLIIGLCNDELGYIVPPSDFLLNETMPYVEKTEDPTGENHYEETNSCGPETARVIADVFGSLLAALAE
ncbi:MAG: hypothetical protein E7631_03375 [Ruminococcaceae bacterium]|nr:hypothetical protein [Oscillospiraceae bacterium]